MNTEELTTIQGAITEESIPLKNLSLAKGIIDFRKNLRTLSTMRHVEAIVAVNKMLENRSLLPSAETIYFSNLVVMAEMERTEATNDIIRSVLDFSLKGGNDDLFGKAVYLALVRMPQLIEDDEVFDKILLRARGNGNNSTLYELKKYFIDHNEKYDEKRKEQKLLAIFSEEIEIEFQKDELHNLIHRVKACNPYGLGHQQYLKPLFEKIRTLLSRYESTRLFKLAVDPIDDYGSEVYIALSLLELTQRKLVSF
jgi:hypothetical protein